MEAATAVEPTKLDEGGHSSPWQVPAIGIEDERPDFVSYCEARTYGCSTSNMKTQDINESHIVLLALVLPMVTLS